MLKTWAYVVHAYIWGLDIWYAITGGATKVMFVIYFQDNLATCDPDLNNKRSLMSCKESIERERERDVITNC